MAVRYYDDIIVEKIKRWIPQESNLRVLKPDETTRLFETKADDQNDAPINLPIIAVSRSKDIEIETAIKTPKSFDGLRLDAVENNKNSNAGTYVLNVIPIKLTYQLDIYTKTYAEGDEYVRSFLFKLINNPNLVISIPYNNTSYTHTAKIRVLSTVSDTSDISEHLFAGQFTRWTIQLEIQDAFLFNMPYKQNWALDGIKLECAKDLSSIKVDESTNISCNCKNK